VQSGAAGKDGTDNQFGAGGNGGNSTVIIGQNLMVLKDSDFNFTIGNSETNSDGGIFTFTVGNNLEITKNQAVRMFINGTMDPAVGGDLISFETLLFDPDSSFTTASTVYSHTNNGTTSSFYRVRDLDVITRGTWRTAGTYAPDNINGTNDDFVRFDLTDDSPNELVLTFAGTSGIANLTDFDPVEQHNLYLADEDWSKKSDVPAFEAYRSVNLPPAFLTSLYQTKRLDLKNITLVDKTTGTLPNQISELRADGNTHYISKGNNAKNNSLYDDFAFTAGLRRYYWDVYIDNDPNKSFPLVAHNYHTADATKVYTQSAGATVASTVQTFNNTLQAFRTLDSATAVNTANMGAYVGGSHIRTKTGSHVDVDNFSAALLLEKKLGHEYGETTVGLFGEFGTGDYDTYSNVPRYGEIFGDGEVQTYGGGLLFKTTFTQNTSIEASVRGGGIKNTFSVTRDPYLKNPQIHSSESDNAYFGGHLGVTQKFDINDLTNIEGYGQFLWTRTTQDDFVTRFGDDVHIDPTDSSRARVGARLNRNLFDDKIKLYVGAAVENEFDGKITGTYAQDRITNPAKIEGVSGFGEIGIDIKPTESKNVSINLDVFGWAGRQQGVGGNATLGFSF
jgi:hypothetical protein